jgi:hypothetical protein
MSRIELQPDIVRMVAELERRFNEFKERQLVGSDAVKTFMTTTPNTWDFSIFLANNQIKEVIVTFTPEDVSGKTTAGAYMLKWLGNQSDIQVQRMRVTDFKQQKWRVTLIGFNATAQIKFWVFSTGKGEITFTLI